MEIRDVMAYLLEQQPFQLLTTIIQPLAICGVHDPDERVGLLEVVLPVRAQRFLPAHVPWDVVSIERKGG